MSVQESLVEAWVGNGLLQGWGTEYSILISPCYSLELCIQMLISFLFFFAFRFPSFHSYLWGLLRQPFCIWDYYLFYYFTTIWNNIAAFPSELQEQLHGKNTGYSNTMNISHVVENLSRLTCSHTSQQCRVATLITDPNTLLSPHYWAFREIHSFTQQTLNKHLY